MHHLAPSDLRWRAVEATELDRGVPSGTELANDGLSAALRQHKLDFSQAELDALGLNAELRHDSYVRAGGAFYKPAGKVYLKDVDGIVFLDEADRQVSGFRLPSERLPIASRLPSELPSRASFLRLLL